MSRHAARATTALAVTATLVLGVQLCGEGAASAATHGRATVKISVSSKHRVAAPATQHPGLVRLVNTGSREILLVRKVHKGVSDLVKEDNAITSNATQARFLRDFSIVDVLAARADEYVRLSNGTYYVVDSSTARITSAQVRTVSVHGARQNAAAPKAALVMSSSKGTVAAGVTTARNHYVHVVNNNGGPRIVSIQAVKPSATAQQIHDVIVDPAHHDYRAILAAFFEPLGEMSGHTELYKLVKGGPGRYLLFSASLVSPGLAKGQIGLLTVK